MGRRKPLPGRPSELIGVALEDLAMAEGSLDYTVDMTHWHAPPSTVMGSPDGTCHVCLAGAVMAFSLGNPRLRDLRPVNFSQPARARLVAIDLLRTGYVRDALEILGLHHAMTGWTSGPPSRVEVRTYQLSPDGFKEDMKSMATMLEGYGL